MRKHCFIAAIAFATTAAHAQQWYMDFGAGRATANGHPVPVTGTIPSNEGTLTSFSYSPMTGSDTAFTVRGGARFGPYLAIEASYFRLGDYELATVAGNPGVVSSFDASARSAGAAVVGILPLAPVDLYARAGYARTQIKADESINGSAINVDERFNEAYYGAGARWNVTQQLGVFAEYQRHEKLDLDAWFVGMQWRF
jgi:hypothetical protein